VGSLKLRRRMKGDVKLADMTFPILWFGDQTFTPAICPGDLKFVNQAWAIPSCEGIESECLLAEFVDYAAEALPSPDGGGVSILFVCRAGDVEGTMRRRRKR
jgi:hypothetical protein